MNRGSNGMPVASLHALLAGSIDYAGMFPPTDLALETALANYAQYLRSSEVWMLAAFVLPVAKFSDAARNLALFVGEHRLRISALGSKTDNPSEFRDTLAKVVETIGDFNVRHAAAAAINQIEIALPSQPGVTATEIGDLLGQLRVPVFLEAPADEAERVIASLAEYNGTRQTRPELSFKLRTGGIIASAFPSSVQIARALVAAVTDGVPIKFTAGLHHAVRQFHASVQTKMHGFLNVLGAGVLAAEHKWDTQQTAAMLEDEEASSFSFDDDRFAWRAWAVTTDRIGLHRKLITSFGSCSFDEPREDLRELNLLPSAA
jgi:hypothetical protein